MLKRFLLTLVVALAALVVPAAAGAQAAAAPQRIVAVGDLHGDYDAWIDIARAAGLIDARKRWAGGNTVLVQMGDVTDREADSLKIIRSLQQLAKAAPRSGGKVIVILGNHEAMNLLGDLRYTTAGEFAAFVDRGSVARRAQLYETYRPQIEAALHVRDPTMTPAAIRDAWIKATPLGWAEQRAAWKPDGELGRWARANPAVAKVGDTLFVHGGISPAYAKLPIDEINRRVAAAMAAADDSDSSILDDQDGPLWYRGLANAPPEPGEAKSAAAPAAPPPSIDQQVDAIVAAYRVKRIVIGHTPRLAGIVITSNGRLARIDTGNSRFYGGQLSYLEILGDRMVPHDVKRSHP